MTGERQLFLQDGICDGDGDGLGFGLDFTEAVWLRGRRMAGKAMLQSFIPDILNKAGLEWYCLLICE